MMPAPRRIAILCIALGAHAGAAQGQGTVADSAATQRYTLAVIGDTPYGPRKLEEFPRLISLINVDTSVNVVVHLGDIKLGTNSPCTDEYNATMRALFDSFTAPMVYTPGDNEWTDCHFDTKRNGLYMPTERLQAVRKVFFPVPGQTLGGRKMQVLSQASDTANRAYVENVMWTAARVVFATLNVPGSDDDAEPWGSEFPPNFEAFQAQPDERAARGRANRAWVSRTFDMATAQNAAGVVLMFQADMWDTTAALHGYDVLVRHIGTLAAAFKRPVLLLEGDSHVYRVDRPYADSGFTTLHRGAPIAANVTRIVVEGANGRTEYLRVTVDPNGPTLFTYERVPL